MAGKRKRAAKKSKAVKARTASRTVNGHDTLREVEQFLYRQARSEEHTSELQSH